MVTRNEKSFTLESNPENITIWQSEILNKNHIIAFDFVNKYPLTKFMDEAQIDYETSLIKDGVDINVAFIGFGEIAQQLFITSVANNQFLQNGEGEPVLKAVKYSIFDNSENSDNLNNGYYRYKNALKNMNSEDYLPLPPLPSEETYYKLDAFDCDFYEKIRDMSTRNKNDANFIVIAFGSDAKNIDVAQKLIEKREEWKIENLVIFVLLSNMNKEQAKLCDKSCYFIGNESDNTICDILRMAQMRNEVYDLEYALTSNPDLIIDEEYIKQNKISANRNWYASKNQTERESSIYGCLSIRSKLNLMGLDCVSSFEDGEALSEEEYLSIYAGEDRPDIDFYGIKANGKSVVRYTLDFKSSRRKNMAIHEHQRWNSFMISKGFIPSTREQIESETVFDKKKGLCFTNGKSYSERRHGNLTTFDGLVEYRQIIAIRDNTSEEAKDVIKYDYQLLDDAYWLLCSNGYKIIKKQKIK